MRRGLTPANSSRSRAVAAETAISASAANSAPGRWRRRLSRVSRCTVCGRRRNARSCTVGTSARTAARWRLGTKKFGAKKTSLPSRKQQQRLDHRAKDGERGANREQEPVRDVVDPEAGAQRRRQRRRRGLLRRGEGVRVQVQLDRGVDLGEPRQQVPLVPPHAAHPLEEREDVHPDRQRLLAEDGVPVPPPHARRQGAEDVPQQVTEERKSDPEAACHRRERVHYGTGPCGGSPSSSRWPPSAVSSPRSLGGGGPLRRAPAPRRWPRPPLQSRRRPMASW